MQKQLQSINLNNYRSYDDETIEFKNLTGIVGLNNQGKTNVFRALNMVLTNDNFREKDIRRGTKSGSVTVTFTDGSWIKRGAGPKEDPLVLCDGVNDPVPYGKYSDMTEAVQQFTGFLDVSLEKKSTPESIQIVSVTAPQGFLIEKSSPETILRRINRLAGGSGVDVAKIELEKLLKDQNKTQATLSVAVEESTKVVDKYKAIDVTSYKKRISDITDGVSNLNAQKNSQQTLLEIAPTLKKVSTVAKARELHAKIERNFDAIQDALDTIEDDKETLTELEYCKEVADNSLVNLKDLYMSEDHLSDDIAKYENELLEAKLQEKMKQRVAEEQAAIANRAEALASEPTPVVNTSTPSVKKFTQQTKPIEGTTSASVIDVPPYSMVAIEVLEL